MIILTLVRRGMGKTLQVNTVAYVYEEKAA